MPEWKELIFSEETGFSEKLEKVFKYQYEKNGVYRRYCKALSYEWDPGSTPPLLPIRAFKEADITTSPDKEPDLVFKSSGTSGRKRSIHRVTDASLYEASLLNGFRQFYDLEAAVIWGYTPGYTDNPHSSLIHMIRKLIEQDKSGLSRFLPLDRPLNPDEISKVEEQGKMLILFGAAFGLLDLLGLEEVTLPSNSIVIETGGMKTHRRQITRKELHQKLAKGFALDSSHIHSEYGMAELLSQAYATGSSWYRTVPWMEVSIRKPENPFEEQRPHQEGLIGVIDLANVYSCSFLLTGDKGMIDNKGRFKVMGRWNPKDLRGCNFLIEED